jgi:hypothetical protein
MAAFSLSASRFRAESACEELMVVFAGVFGFAEDVPTDPVELVLDPDVGFMYLLV